MDCRLETQQQEDGGRLLQSLKLTPEAAEKSKKRSKKSFKVQRAIAGMSINDIQKRREQKAELTKKSKEAALA